ncbi:Fructosamine-3-kinase [Saccharopolyspora shandongensis]|uniref:Fructosamine-3-kinase n=1 Tax=Saccharopolyspora shandongensis TaxID=418495 RepID=A0A1H3GA84_9PSEU|nr:Fructosamine-3-kinase [Saccharopolyspora shandongensis]
MRDSVRLGGGDSAATFVVELGDGERVLAKTAPADATAAEAAGLRWLADTTTVPVPAVLATNDQWLVTEHIPGGEPTATAAEAFGRGLAALHAAGAPAFGAAPPGGPTHARIGAAPMRNIAAPSWPEFYAEHRLLPFLALAVDAHALTPDEARVVEAVIERLDEFAGPAEPPARLHGDLWHGNVHWGADGRAWLIDPAAHGGHRETDLAMLHLFGCPHLDRIVAAYHEVAPLADGWRQRIGLHQLFPLLVHTALFGRSYTAQLVATAEAVLGDRSTSASSIVERLTGMIRADLAAVAHMPPGGDAPARTKGHVRGGLDALVLVLEHELGRPVNFHEARALLRGERSVTELRERGSD